jgi:hypothetical protein
MAGNVPVLIRDHSIPTPRPLNTPTHSDLFMITAPTSKAAETASLLPEKPRMTMKIEKKTKT